MIEQFVLGLHEVDETQVAVVGGKGAHLGGLSRVDGIRVPAGFCVTTDAFRRIMAEAPSIGDRLDQLSRLDPDDLQARRYARLRAIGTVLEGEAAALRVGTPSLGARIGRLLGLPGASSTITPDDEDLDEEGA